jgi:hypothetical protein
MMLSPPLPAPNMLSGNWDDTATLSAQDCFEPGREKSNIVGGGGFSQIGGSTILWNAMIYVSAHWEDLG